MLVSIDHMDFFLKTLVDNVEKGMFVFFLTIDWLNILKWQMEIFLISN